MTEIAGAQMLNQVGMVNLMLGGVCKITGKETEVSGATVDVRGGTVVVKGAPIKLGEAGAPITKLEKPPKGGNGSASTDGSYSDVGSGGSSDDIQRPSRDPDYFVKPDGTKIPLDEVDSPENKDKIPVYEEEGVREKGKDGQYHRDDQDNDGVKDPFIVIDKDLPAHQKDEELAHEAAHQTNRLSGDRRDAEIDSQKKEIERIRQSRNKYSDEDYQARLDEEEDKLELLQGKRQVDRSDPARGVDDLNMLNTYPSDKDRPHSDREQLEAERRHNERKRREEERKRRAQEQERKAREARAAQERAEERRKHEELLKRLEKIGKEKKPGDGLDTF